MTQPLPWPLWPALDQTSAAGSPNSQPAQNSGEKSLLTPDEASAGVDQLADSAVQSLDDATDVEVVKDPDDRATRNSRVQVKPIGYGSPPVAYQWPKLQSGNPRGRPKKNKSGNAVEAIEGRLLSVVRREADRKVKLSDRGKPITIRTLEGIIRGSAIKSLQGNSREKKIFLDLYKESEREPHLNIIDLVGPKLSKREIEIILGHPKIQKVIEEKINEHFTWILGLLTQEQRDELRKFLSAAAQGGDDDEGRSA